MILQTLITTGASLLFKSLFSVCLTTIHHCQKQVLNSDGTRTSVLCSQESQRVTGDLSDSCHTIIIIIGLFAAWQGMVALRNNRQLWSWQERLSNEMHRTTILSLFVGLVGMFVCCHTKSYHCNGHKISSDSVQHFKIHFCIEFVCTI